MTIAVDTGSLPLTGSPQAARTPLWAHQRTAADAAAAHRGFMLAMGLGSGKSLTTIEILEREHATKVLILCPKSVIGVWPEQFAQHASGNWHVWAGDVLGNRGTRLRNPSVAERAASIVEATTHALIAGRPLAVVVNYDAIWRADMAAILRGTGWDAVVLDESHRIKSPTGKASKLAADVSRRARERGGRVLALTGTPMPHSPLDLWAQMRALDGGARLGRNYHHFCKVFGNPEQIYLGGVTRTVFKTLREDRRDEFTRLVSPVMHQVATTDVLNLPATKNVYRTCELSPPSRRAYDQLEKDLIADLDDGSVITAANAMVLVLRLAQAANGFGRDAITGEWLQLSTGDLTEKAELLGDVLEDLPLREPVVVFCRFHADLDAVAAACARQDRRYGELSGRRRDGLDTDATMAKDIDVLGCQLQSGGTGVDLTRASIAIYYSLDFRLAEHDQSRARVHRPGQTRPVTYVYLLARDTVDQAIYGALRKRRIVVDSVLRDLREGHR